MDNGCRIGACAGVGKPIEILNCAQDIVVGNTLSVSTGPHHRSDKERYDPVILFSVIFVPRHDQEAVVLLRPLDIHPSPLMNPLAHPISITAWFNRTREESQVACQGES